MSSDATPQNAWVDSYLNALLTYGLSSEYTTQAKDQGQKFQDADRSTYSRFYVNSLLGLDEEALSSAYFKAASAKQGSNKDSRMQYLSWRIWFLKRRAAAVQRSHHDQAYLQEEDSGPAGVASPGYSSDEDQPRGPAEPRTSRLSHDSRTTSDGRGLAASTAGPSDGDLEDRLRRLSVKIAPERSVDDVVATPEATPLATAEPRRFDRLYVVMISLHGLVRGDRMELGKDSDTGGQVKYVVELAKAMALHPAVHRVDLLTRLIRDPKVHADYGVEEECLERGMGETGGAYICRIPCGPVDQYIRKERLWPYVREFADNGIQHVRRTLAAMAKDGHRGELYVVHGHYADAGEVAVLMSSALDSRMIMTGHSLGRNKLEHLLKGGNVTRSEIEEVYAIGRRIEAEERALDCAMMVFTSTQQEVDEQWGLYDGYSPSLARVLHFRRASGRHMPIMTVSPPGLDFSNLKVNIPEDPVVKEFARQRAAFARLQSGGSELPDVAESPRVENSEGGGDQETRPETLDPTVALIPEGPRIWQDIARFLRNPLKPAVLAMSRPDPKKNITTLVKAFGENPMLRELSNLVLIMGNRDDIDSMAGGSQKVLVEVLKLIDLYDLHGSVAYPKHHDQSEISDIYSFATATHGVFTNIALQEPFGLTVIEAAAHGAPTVATCNGGPVDIMATLHHGVTVEPTDSKAVAAALLNILTNPTVWSEMSINGVKNIMAYSWPSHVKRYVAHVDRASRFIKSWKGYDRSMSGFYAGRLAMIEDAEEHDDDLAVDVRQYSMPPTSSQMGLSVLSPTRKQASGLSTDDLAILQSLGDQIGSAPTFVLAQRKTVVMVLIDSEVAAPAALALLKAIIPTVAGAPHAGVGILSMRGFDATCADLKAAGVDTKSLDAMVCNAGADAWLRSTKGDWDADDAYQSVVEFAWDRVALHRTLKKIVSQPATDHKVLPKLKELLYDVVEKPLQGVHPRHICIDLNAETQAILAAGMGPRARQAKDLPHQVVDRLRRRLRRKGFRANYTLQTISGATEGDVIHALHLTPVRASRSMGMRLLAAHATCAISDFLLVAPALASQGSVVAGHASDLGDLIAGAQHVAIVPAEAGSTEGSALALANCGVDTAPWTGYGDRVELVSADDLPAKVAAHVAAHAQ